MFIYSSVSPYYLDYVASTMTRQEILDDPKYCFLLENPYIKDNMELALKYKESKRAGSDNGGTNNDAIKDFVEYFIANGPELDPDTILYYREKVLIDPVYAQVAERVAVDITGIDLIRTTIYNKPEEEDNCYNMPCNYLEPINAQVGMMGDSNNFLTLTNIFSMIIQEKEDEKKIEEQATFLGRYIKDSSDKNKKDKNGDHNVWGHIRQHTTQKIIPSVRESIQGFYDYMGNEMKDFAERCANTGIGRFLSLGDAFAFNRAELISASTKFNVNQKLGDCARLWKHLRKYNPYDMAQNQKLPIPDENIIANKSTQGTSIDNTKVTSVIKKVTPSTVSKAAANGDKTAQAIEKLNKLEWAYTAHDIELLKKPDSEFSREEKLALISKIMGEANNKAAAYRKAENKILDASGIGDSGDDYGRWSEARSNKDAKNEEIANEFMKLVNAIRSSETGADENTRKEASNSKSENEIAYKTIKDNA